MIIENISPVIFYIGPLAVRWYGLMMALSFALGIYFLVKNGTKRGLSEDFLLKLSIAAVIGAVIGARAIFVLTNLPYFMANLAEIHRIDHGGLSFHGGLLGGVLAGWLGAWRQRVSFSVLLDLAVPGIAIGLTLVRIANIFNQEILGRTTLLLPFERHPAQIYGSLIGLSLLLIHNYLARRHSAPGALFWRFFLYYTLLRGLIEETFRENPLFALGYINQNWGFGFFTLLQLFTPALILLALFMIRRTASLNRS